jgi:hypothetical protein
MSRNALIILIILMFSGAGTFGQVPDICLTKEEYRLYSVINEYRAKQGLSIIPVSRSLCYVAKVHARDLYFNRPDTGFCSLNSWSDKGMWTACCHSKYTPNPSCIVNKPAELTKYAGEGHEVCYWESEDLQPDTVFKFWLSVEPSRELLLNQKKWSYFTWNAMGVGLYKGYACVWVGEGRDTIPEPKLCADKPGSNDFIMPLKDSQKDVVSASTGRSYIIFGSFGSLDDAVKMAQKYKKNGFSQAKVIVKDNTYRVSLADYPTQKEALDAKKLLSDEYKESWVMKF